MKNKMKMWRRKAEKGKGRKLKEQMQMMNLVNGPRVYPLLANLLSRLNEKESNDAAV